MWAAAIATAVSWLVLFLVLLAVPGDDGEPAVQGLPGESPAVVSLLDRKLAARGFGATLADLAVRGWFRLSAPDVAQDHRGHRRVHLRPGLLLRRRVTVAHVRVNLDHRAKVSIAAVEPAPGAHPLADIAWLANPAGGSPWPD
jgi:hypothetical protein